MSNGTRLVRRAIWFLLAVCACLPAPTAAARPAGEPRQQSTRDKKPDKKKPATGTTTRKPKRPAKPGAPGGPEQPTPTPAPAETDIFKNIQLRIVIAGESGAAPRRIKVTLWSRERGEPALPQSVNAPAKGEDAYVVSLPKGLHRKKDYWVTVTSADERLSGDAAVPPPVDHNDLLPIRVALYPAVTFEVADGGEGKGSPGEGSVSVVEKSQEPSSAIPHAPGPDGKASFVMGLNPQAEYALLTGDGRRLKVDPDKIKDGVLRMSLSGGRPSETVVKVSTEAEGRPIKDARVIVTFDDSKHGVTPTNEQGVAVFKEDARRVRAVEVEVPGHEKYSCGRENEDACPEPDESGALVITLKDTSRFGWVGPFLKSATGVVFVLAASLFIIIGVAVFRILLNPEPTHAPSYTPPVGRTRAAAVPKAAAAAATSAGVETSSQADGQGAQEAGAALVQHGAAPASHAGDATQPDPSPAAEAYSVPGSLSAEMAKEAYKRWVRKEKLTRGPVRLDLVFNNSTYDQSRMLKETNDPASKFILFTDGESSGWLFPNPAPSVLLTEVEQTWRQVFENLSKEEFGRKMERLNPVAARRAGGADGRGMWTAEPKPYEFG